jgi:asparagine synthase (glutamine-hydrolysing)
VSGVASESGVVCVNDDSRGALEIGFRPPALGNFPNRARPTRERSRTLGGCGRELASIWFVFKLNGLGKMCGIAATFGAGTSMASLGRLVSERLSHRGPDGVGAGSTGRAVVAHSRLAIVDVVGGAQPMESDDGQTLLVCNGEIYNHRQLRRLIPSGRRLRSQCDSEIVLRLFEESGDACIQHLDGMFAFFVTDGDHFLAARDPFGIKPLYMGEDLEGGLWFASELKALVDRCPSIGAVPPGSYVTESRKARAWFEPAWAGRVGSRPSVSPDELLGHLERAVVKRLMSDVPLGILLSGGLDSSLVAALARRHLSRLKTFAVGVEGAPDLLAARHVATKLAADHRECVYTLDDVLRRLPEVIYHLESYDLALIRSAIPCYFVSAMASEDVKVVLTGEGADELFAGYGYMQGIGHPSLLHRECVRLLFGLHSMNLQRVDRMTMAHGLEGRVPFLDVEFVDWAMSLDPKLKLREPRLLEKRLLRQAAEQVLPTEIAHRPKLEFSQGSASSLLLERHADGCVSDRDLAAAGGRFPLDTPRTKEELLYRLIFDDLFPGEAMRRTVSRWHVPRPPVMAS